MKKIYRDILKTIFLLILTVIFLNSITKIAYAMMPTQPQVHATVEYRDENGNLIDTEGAIAIPTPFPGQYNVTFTFNGSFVKNGKTYIVSYDKSKDSLQTRGGVDISNLSTTWSSKKFTITDGPVPVPALPDPDYTIPVPYVLICREDVYPYTIHYEDESGNRLINDQVGSVPDMSWVDLNMEFSATNYDAGTVYVVRRTQAYNSSSYQYNSATDGKVQTGANAPEYTIVCIKKNIIATPSQATPSRATPSSSGGGGSESTVRRQTVKEGWILDNDTWYYYSGATRSTLKKGWHHDPQDSRWYYLDLTTGAMFVEWHMISGEWYYFNPYTPKWTWELRNDGEWYYKNLENSRPLGSMYANEKTPDGYSVDGNGRYIH